jgi:hypothetical protein
MLVDHYLNPKCETNRIAPGSIVTSAAVIVVEALKVDESTTLTVPPESCVGLTLERGNVNGLGTVPCGLSGASALAGGS